jgi:hypothetical protein
MAPAPATPAAIIRQRSWTRNGPFMQAGDAIFTPRRIRSGRESADSRARPLAGAQASAVTRYRQIGVSRVCHDVRDHDTTTLWPRIARLES